MGLLSILRKLRIKEKEVRILLLGLDNSGKTTLLRRLNGESIDHISPTLGFNIKTVQFDQYKVNLWDIGGQKSLRSYWRNYFEGTDGVVWVVDSWDAARLQDCRDELHRLLQEERLLGASLLVLANKQDLEGALTAEEIAARLDLAGLAGSRHVEVRAASARTGQGLANGFRWLLQDISQRIFFLD